jgi:hypothetical protein
VTPARLAAAAAVAPEVLDAMPLAVSRPRIRLGICDRKQKQEQERYSCGKRSHSFPPRSNLVRKRTGGCSGSKADWRSRGRCASRGSEEEGPKGFAARLSPAPCPPTRRGAMPRAPTLNPVGRAGRDLASCDLAAPEGPSVTNAPRLTSTNKLISPASDDAS